jgi:charged multivesicular body protein 3
LPKVITLIDVGAKADTYAKKTFARQMLQCQKNMDRYSVNKAKIKNLEYQMDSFMANAKMAQVMGATGNLMAEVNKKINITGTQAAMNKAQEEFMKMGLMQEMIDDALQSNDIDDIDIDE